MDKIYNKTTWEDLPSQATPINADNLNNIENGIDALDDRIVEMDAELEETKKSVSDGKTEVASAITQKGVATASDASFDTMADNILRISGGTPTGDVEFTLLGQENDTTSTEHTITVEDMSKYDLIAITFTPLVKNALYSIDIKTPIFLVVTYDEFIKGVQYHCIYGTTSTYSVDISYVNDNTITVRKDSRGSSTWYIYGISKVTKHQDRYIKTASGISDYYTDNAFHFIDIGFRPKYISVMAYSAEAMTTVVNTFIYNVDLDANKVWYTTSSSTNNSENIGVTLTPMANGFDFKFANSKRRIRYFAIGESDTP